MRIHGPNALGETKNTKKNSKTLEKIKKVVYYGFRDALKEKDYVKIRTQRLQGLVLNVFCLRKHMTHLRLVEARYTKTGFGGMWVRNLP